MRRHAGLAMLCAALNAEAAQGQLALPPPAKPQPPGAEAAADRRYDLLFERPAVPTLPRGWTVDFDGQPCATCPTRWSPGVVNGNAPWQMSGTVSWQGDDSSARLGLTARRHARLPVYMAPGGHPAHVASASEAQLSDPRTQLVLTLGGERIVWRSTSGVTMSWFTDLYLPVGTTGRAKVSKDVPKASNAALLSGVRVRF